MAKTLAIVLGIVFVIAGALGFIPNSFVGGGALFDTNLTHDLVHLVTGIILLAVALMAPAKSGTWLKILGVVYLLIAVLGFVLTPNGGSLLGLVQVNMADNLLHVVLGIVLVAAGFAGKSTSAPAAPVAAAPVPPAGGTM